MASGSSKFWLDLLTNLQMVIDQVEDGEADRKPTQEFDKTAYWKKLGDVFKALSHEATKLSIVYSKPPLPSNQECESLLKSMEKVVLSMVSVFYSLPKSQGLTLRKRIKHRVKTSIEKVKSLAETISQQTACSPEQLRTTATVWEEADCFSLLPKDNKEAVLMIMDRNTPMVDDALKELDEALDAEEDDDGLDEFLGISSPQNDHHLSETDKVLVGYCMGIVKCSKSVLKKSRSAVKANGNCDSEGSIAQLDDLADHVERLSPSVDELATCLYPPIRKDVVHKHVQQLHEVNTNLLSFLKLSHMTTEDDAKWVEFLLRASSHNMNKIETCLGKT